MSTLALLAAVALVLANALFVAAEFAAVAVRRAQLEPVANTSKRARRALDALGRLSALLAGAQVGITVSSLGLGALAEPAVAHLLEGPLTAVGTPESAVPPIAFVIALLIVVSVHVIIGEMVPKNLSLALVERAAIALVPALDTFVRVIGPFITLTNGAANATLRMFGVEPKNEASGEYTAAELADILEDSRSQGLLDPDAYRRLARALQIDARTAADVMTPFADLVTIAPDTTAAEVEALVTSTGFSRYPVLDSGRLLGYVHVKDLFDLDPGDRPAANAHTLPVLAPDLTLPAVVARLRRGGGHLAAVADASGKVLGAVALDAALGELIAVTA